MEWPWDNVDSEKVGGGMSSGVEIRRWQNGSTGAESSTLSSCEPSGTWRAKPSGAPRTAREITYRSFPA
jgi:hypothetical protein